MVEAYTQVSEPTGSTPSLIGNNLTSSGNLVAFASKNMIRIVNPSQFKTMEGPSVAGSVVTHVRYLPLMTGEWVLCVSSTVGTQLYSEDGSHLLHLLPVEKSSPIDQGGGGSGAAERLACHRGACALPPDLNGGRQMLCFGDYLGRTNVVDFRAMGGFSSSCSRIESNSGTAGGSRHGVTCMESVLQPSAVVNERGMPSCELIVGHEDGSLFWWSVAYNPAGIDAEQSMLYECLHTDTFEDVPVTICSIGSSLAVGFGSGRIIVYFGRSRFAEIAAHARWITGMTCWSDLNLIATVSEDTVLNVWKISDDTGIQIVHSSQITTKLLTGVCFMSAGELGCVAYDSDCLFKLRRK